jgi:hypothetical protein
LIVTEMDREGKDRRRPTAKRWPMKPATSQPRIPATRTFKRPFRPSAAERKRIIAVRRVAHGIFTATPSRRWQRLRRRLSSKLPGFHHGFKSHPLVAAIAKRFILGLTAAAKADRGATGKIKSVALGVTNREVPLDPQRPVRSDGDFRFWQEILLETPFRAQQYPPAAGSPDDRSIAR